MGAYVSYSAKIGEDLRLTIGKPSWVERGATSFGNLLLIDINRSHVIGMGSASQMRAEFALP